MWLLPHTSSAVAGSKQPCVGLPVPDSSQHLNKVLMVFEDHHSAFLLGEKMHHLLVEKREILNFDSECRGTMWPV